MFVNATAGSTVYGAFDPIHEIADICEKYNMWLHVDVSASSYYKYRKVIVILIISGMIAIHFHGGLIFSLNISAIFRSNPFEDSKQTVVFVQGAWGGGLLMSRKHRHKLRGVER